MGLKSLGRYLMFISSLFVRMEKPKVYIRQIINECVLIGLDSIIIVVIVSTFIGAVSAIQTAHNLVSPLIPVYVIATVVRDMEISELAPTVTCIVLSGKVGSSIAGGLGTMRISEQIDALEVMGINSSSYLVLPKIIAAVITIPMLVTVSLFLGIYGGYLAGILTGVITEQDYIYGIRAEFNAFNLYFALIKAFVFAFLISSISSFHGYYTQGGALEVGKSSTQAVTSSCIATLAADYILVQLFL